MLDWQVDYIRLNKFKLASSTIASKDILCALRAKNHLSNAECENLDRTMDRVGPTTQAICLYDHLTSRAGSYDDLIEVLESNCQSEAVLILRKGLKLYNLIEIASKNVPGIVLLQKDGWLSETNCTELVNKLDQKKERNQAALMYKFLKKDENSLDDLISALERVIQPTPDQHGPPTKNLKSAPSSSSVETPSRESSYVSASGPCQTLIEEPAQLENPHGTSNMHATTVASLGRLASLGDLYDVRSDALCGVSVFQKKIPDSAVTVTDNPYVKTETVYTDKISEKFKKMNVGAELQLSVIGGLVHTDGSGSYLTDTKTSARSTKLSLIYSMKTKYEKLNILHEDLKHAFALNALHEGTHVVTGISWGANCVISCLVENTETQEMKRIADKVAEHFEKIKCSIIKQGVADIGESACIQDAKIHFTIYSDIFAQQENTPRTLDSAIQLMKQIPRLIFNSNGGKGKPLAYEITPIRVLQSHLKLERHICKTLHAINEDTILRVVQFIEDLSTVQQKLNDICADVTLYKCIQQEKLREIEDKKKDLAIFEASFRKNLSSVLRKVRSGEVGVSNLEELLKEYNTKDNSPNNVNSLHSWSNITEKINFARALVNIGAKYIGFGMSLEAEHLEGFGAKFMIFYFSYDTKSNNPGRWKKNVYLFQQEIRKGTSNCKNYAVDCDVYPVHEHEIIEILKEKSSCVTIVQDGNVLVEDMLEEKEKLKDVPLARVSGKPERMLYTSGKRAPFRIPCTGRSCNPRPFYDWVCNKCFDEFEYGLDSYVYCACGKSPVDSLTFKCTDLKHGDSYECHEETFLNQCVSSLRPFRELNILILGKTGVGKSTWINGFINFLSYQSLEEALQKDLISLIPSQFTMCNENYEEIVISTGNDANEIFEVGNSATQNAKVYQFKIGSSILRLIDTPGIGDTRGIEQDRQNFQNILGTISNLDEIHGICILLIPNDARLDVMFRFCIKELLTNLHKDASKNIVFCFTNSRATMFKPAETLPALRKLLREHTDIDISLSKNTLYCFDGEAFRFLAASKNTPPVQFTQSAMNNFSESWKLSTDETTRLLEYIGGLKPHNVNDTLCLNHARESIIKLTKPLAEIHKIVTTNKSFLEDEMKALNENQLSRKKLEEQKMVTRMELVFVQLDHPRMVCTNKACCVSRAFNDGIRSPYIRCCHERCYLRGISADTIGHQELFRCQVMTNGFCQMCGHSYKEHFRTYYDTQEKEIKVENERIIDLLNKNLTNAKLKEEMIETKMNEIREYNKELDFIRHASASFAYFLKTNAITPYNDAMEQYLDHLIREEEAKVGASKDRTTLENLNAFKRSYIKQRDILEHEMNTCGSGCTPPGPTEVERLVRQLQGLHYSGEQIRQALACVEHTSKVNYNETVVNYDNQLGMTETVKKFFGKLASRFM